MASAALEWQYCFILAGEVVLEPFCGAFFV